MLINVKMPAIVGILRAELISCSAELSIKKFYNLGTRYTFKSDQKTAYHTSAIQ